MAIGSNHVALEVGNFDEVAELLSAFLDCKLCVEFEKMALIDLGDQFIALQSGGPRHGHGSPDKELTDNDMPPD